MANPNGDDGKDSGDGPVAGGYTVLARRYRPQQFDECIGQDHVAQALKNAIEADRVAHAYLFTGARGVGKTSMARIFAKALNCVDGPTVTPCGECDVCSGIASGEDVDVIEIDGASNRGIDEVRELRQGVNYRPSRARLKIYIIDEVHMLTKEAFNALLKTLEEPPPHVKFLFATTEPQKIPITILSRCQRFDFSGIDLPLIIERLRSIVEAEGMKADEEALEVIARRAGGSMRDSQSLLDQVLAFGGERLGADDVHRVMGTAGEERVAQMAAGILAGETASCLGMVDAGVGAGVQLGEWIEQLLDYFRDLMVVGINPDARLVGMPERMRGALAEQGQGVAPERLLEMMDLLASCRNRMRASGFGRILFEMTVVRLCLLDRFLNLEAVLATAPSTSSAPAPVRSPATKKKTVPVEQLPAERPVEPVAPATADPQGVDPQGVDSQEADLETADAQAEGASAGGPQVELSVENLSRFWKMMCAGLDDNVLRGMLQSVRTELVDANVIRAAVPKGAKRHCEEVHRVAKIEQACRALAGRHVTVRLELDSGGTEESGRPKRNESAALMHQARQDPLVQHAEQSFGAKLVGAPRRVRTAATVDPNSENPGK